MDDGPVSWVPAELNPDQLEEVRQWTLRCLFHIAYGALDPVSGEFVAGAATMRTPINRLLRQGWKVWIAGGPPFPAARISRRRVSAEDVFIISDIQLPKPEKD
jgi:hypothetical protein